jgi:predicted transcriptional regulator
MTVPWWFRRFMAMNLRLIEEETAALRRRAEEENRSMQDIVKQALRDYLVRRPERLAGAIDRVVTEDAELLERLSR